MIDTSKTAKINADKPAGRETMPKIVPIRRAYNVVTVAVCATVFEIFTLKDRKLLILPTPPLFEAPAPGNPLECRDEIWYQKTRMMELPESEEIMTLALFVLTQYRLVTDGRTDTLRSLLPALA